MKAAIGVTFALFFASRIWLTISETLTTQRVLTIPTLVLTGVALLFCVCSVIFAVKG